MQLYRGKTRRPEWEGDRGNVGIVRSPLRASILPDQSSNLVRAHQKSGTAAWGIGVVGMPGKNEFGFSAQIASVSGPSAGVASTARRSTGILATAASNSR